MIYDFDKLKSAITFNTAEVLPTDPHQLDKEIKDLIDLANDSGEKIKHYIGFEISGQIHIGTGMATALRIKKLQDAGVRCSIFLADYHTWINNKLDGNIETIRKVATEYFSSVMLQCVQIAGGDPSQVDIIYAKDEYDEEKSKGHKFLAYMLNVSKNLTLSRVNKSISITGKKAGEDIEFGVLCYPVMQVADAFLMQTHLVHAGIDQRKCHVLMREVAHKLDPQFRLKIGSKEIKPIAIHHKLLLSLGISANDTAQKIDTAKAENLKMSKSKADSAIWVHDSPEEIQRKIKKAYCPMPQESQTIEEIEAEQEYNPILNWCQNLIFPAGQIILLKRPEKFGGDKSYKNYESLKKDYFTQKIHPLDLKSSVAETLSKWFQPVREYVEQNPEGLKIIKNLKK